MICKYLRQNYSGPDDEISTETNPFVKRHCVWENRSHSWVAITWITLRAIFTLAEGLGGSPGVYLKHFFSSWIRNFGGFQQKSSANCKVMFFWSISFSATHRTDVINWNLYVFRWKSDFSRKDEICNWIDCVWGILIKCFKDLMSYRLINHNLSSKNKSCRLRYT